MWGHLFSELTYFQNFKFGFPNNHSDILLHLTHWQYWFWFWFTYILVLYYVLFLKLIKKRDLNYYPKIMTSVKSHGKWGDIIVCLLPISWCTNILSNSNFILRMIEWQNEACLFTLRIRGKQWYWVYKFEVQVFDSLLNIQKNVGFNNWWVQWEPFTNSYLWFIQIKKILNDNIYIWGATVNEVDMVAYEKNPIKQICAYIETPITNLMVFEFFFQKNKTFDFMKTVIPRFNNYQFDYLGVIVKPVDYFFTLRKTKIMNGIGQFLWEDQNRLVKEFNMINTIRVLYNKKSELYFKYNLDITFKKKTQTISNYLVVKQKRLGFNESLGTTPFYFTSKTSGPYISDLDETLIYLQNSIKNSKRIISFNNKRLLRTKRVLVVPAHINISLITNSFDVIHSWFIPGLGVKLDCVPGRSTHHTIYINHVGFYYGQCAEICGRYHHHMPIRLCAIPYEHFVVWWYNYGSPYFFTNNLNRVLWNSTVLKSYNW